MKRSHLILFTLVILLLAALLIGAQLMSGTPLLSIEWEPMVVGVKEGIR
jgi:hypothetical protein